MALAPQVDFGLRDHLLYELARDLSSSLELDIVLRKVMDRVITLMKASRGFIVLVDPATGTTSVQMSSGEADPEKTRSFLGSKTVNKQVTDYVLARSDRGTMFLAGERREVTMLNSDIAGFSTLSQSMQAEELVDFLNTYFARMIEVVLEHGGNIDKFQGDGMLVVFGAPNPMVDHAGQALRAARGMVTEIDRLNRELVEAGRPAISVGIGLDTG